MKFYHQWVEWPIHKKASLVAIMSIYFLLFLFLLIQGIGFQPDSNSYIDNSITRAPIYPLFIDFCRWFAGESYLTAILLIQLIFGFYSIITFCFYIQKTFKIPLWLFYLLSLILFTPYLPDLAIGNFVLTEGLAYPMFLIVSKYLFRSVIMKSTRDAIIYFILCIPLILIRGQFLFLYPVSILLLIYLFINAQNGKKRVILLTVVFIVCVITTDISERCYNYVEHSRFVKAPFTGIQLLTPALFISDETDKEIFTDVAQRQLFENWFEEMKNNKANINYPEQEGQVEVEHFLNKYNVICWQIVAPSMSKAPLAKTETKDSWINFDKVATHMAISLIKDNWKGYIFLNSQNCIVGLSQIFFDNVKLTILLFWLLCYILIINLILIIYGDNNPIYLFSFFVIVIHFTNLGAVSLVEPILVRYAFYTNVLIKVIIIFGVYYFLTSLRIPNKTVK